MTRRIARTALQRCLVALLALVLAAGPAADFTATPMGAASSGFCAYKGAKVPCTYDAVAKAWVALLTPSGVAAVATSGSASDLGSGTLPAARLPATVATGSVTARLGTDRAAERYSVRDFGAACDGTTDDSPALAAAATALNNTGGTLTVPGNCRLRLGGAAQVWLNGVHLEGPGTKEYGAQSYTYGATGGTVALDTPSLANGGVSPFLVSSNWSITGLKFYWPGQTEYTAAANGNTPVPFAPLIAPHLTNGVYDPVNDFTFEHNQVENAYDILDLHNVPSTSGVGHYHWDNNKEFAVHYYFWFGGAGGEGWINDNQFTFGAALFLTSGTNTAGPGGTQSPFYLRSAAQASGEVVHITGNGTTSTLASYSVDGMRFNGNYVLGERYGIHVAGGILNIATIDNDGFDQVSTVLAADSGGNFAATTVHGGTWLCENLNAQSLVIQASCVTINGGAPGSRLSLSNVQMPVTLGRGIRFVDTGDALLSIVGGDLLNFGNLNAGNPFNGIEFTAANGVLNVAGLSMSTTAANNTGAQCIVIGAAKAANVAGVNFRGCNVPEVVNATTGQYSLTGSTSFGSTASVGTAAVLGTGAALVAQSGNSWDIQPNGLYVPPISLAPNTNSQAEVSSAVSSAGTVVSTLRQTDVNGDYNVTANGINIKMGASGLGSGNHLYCSGAAPTVTASAGTVTSSAGITDCHGTITTTAAATVNVVFSKATANAPDCVISPHGGAFPSYATTGGALGTAGLSLTTAAAQTDTYDCHGR